MVRSKGITKEDQNKLAQAASKVALSQSEVEGLNDEKKGLQETINESSDGVSRGADVQQLKNRVAAIDRAIEARIPEEARGRAKDSLVREEHEIEDKLIVGMPTRYEMENPHKCPGAVRKHMAWDARNKPLIRRYVEIQRVLRPDEPKSIEELRSEGGPRK